MNTTRRKLLRYGAPFATTGLCGCSAPLSSEDEGIVLGTVAVTTRSRFEETVRIEVERDGELLAERTITLEPNADPKLLSPDWPSISAVYTVRATHTDAEEIYEQTITKEQAAVVDNADAPCLPVVVGVGWPDLDENAAIDIGANPYDPSMECPSGARCRTTDE